MTQRLCIKCGQPDVTTWTVGQGKVRKDLQLCIIHAEPLVDLMNLDPPIRATQSAKGRNAPRHIRAEPKPTPLDWFRP